MPKSESARHAVVLPVARHERYGMALPEGGHTDWEVELGCAVNGEQIRLSRTSKLIFSVPALIERLSAVMPLLPGGVIFTGTPAGVGLGLTSWRWLAPGDELVSYIEGIGELRHRFR